MSCKMMSTPSASPIHTQMKPKQVMRLRQAGKVVVASIAGVAASGGYYIAMGCEKIVCDEMSITGSIGVVQSKFSLGELFEKVPDLVRAVVLRVCRVGGSMSRERMLFGFVLFILCVASVGGFVWMDSRVCG